MWFYDKDPFLTLATFKEMANGDPNKPPTLVHEPLP